MATEVNFFEDPPMTQRTFVQNFTSRLQFSLVIFSFLWLSVAFFWLYRAVTHAGQKIDFFVAIYLFLTILCSVVGFVLAFIDKRRSVRDRRVFLNKHSMPFSRRGLAGDLYRQLAFSPQDTKDLLSGDVLADCDGTSLNHFLWHLLTWWPANSEPSNISKPPRPSSHGSLLNLFFHQLVQRVNVPFSHSFCSPLTDISYESMFCGLV